MDVTEAIRRVQTRRGSNLQWHELAEAADVLAAEVERLRDVMRAVAWEQIGESAAYWDVGERCETPYSAAPGEMAYIPVCRVKKHSRGGMNLRRILSVPQMERRIAVLEAALQPFADRGRAMVSSVDDDAFFSVPVAELRAAAAAREE